MSSSFDPRVSTFMIDRGDEDLVDFCSAFSRRRRYHLSGELHGNCIDSDASSGRQVMCVAQRLLFVSRDHRGDATTGAGITPFQEESRQLSSCVGALVSSSPSV